MLTMTSIVAFLGPMPMGLGIAAMVLRARLGVWLILWSVLGTAGLLLSFQAQFSGFSTLAFSFSSGLLAAHLIGLALIDWRLSLVPDLLTVPFVLIGLLNAWVILDLGLEHLLCAISLAFLVMLLREGAALLLRDRQIIGSGDVIMVAGVGAWLGPFGAPDALFLSLVFASATMVALRWKRVPFAPSLAAATWIVWVYGAVASTRISGLMRLF
jgi:prepilin signal peptidase PulO-like enzyme (type II secretory pathway)